MYVYMFYSTLFKMLLKDVLIYLLGYMINTRT